MNGMRSCMAALLLATTACAVQAAERAIDKSVEIAATLDQAWQSWTTREGITSFFAPDAKIEPRVGGAFQVYIDPGAPAGSKGADDMRYLALQPQRMLSFDWNAPPSLPEVRAQRTVVILRFEPVDANTTRIRLHHVGWGDGGEWDRAYAYFDRAWGNQRVGQPEETLGERADRLGALGRAVAQDARGRGCLGACAIA